MGDVTTPNVIVIPKETLIKTVTSVLSGTQSIVTVTGTPSTVISSTTIITTATSTSTPTDGIFITTTAEIFIFIIGIVLLVTNIATALQYTRVRTKGDKKKDLEKLVKTVLNNPDET